MKPECGEEANNTIGNASGHFGQRVVFRDLGIRERIEPTAHMSQFPACGQPAQVFGMNTLNLDVPKAQNALLLREADDLSCRTGRLHGV